MFHLSSPELNAGRSWVVVLLVHKGPKTSAGTDENVSLCNPNSEERKQKTQFCTMIWTNVMCSTHEAVITFYNLWTSRILRSSLILWLFWTASCVKACPQSGSFHCKSPNWTLGLSEINTQVVTWLIQSTCYRFTMAQGKCGSKLRYRGWRTNSHGNESLNPIRNLGRLGHRYNGKPLGYEECWRSKSVALETQTLMQGPNSIPRALKPITRQFSMVAKPSGKVIRHKYYPNVHLKSLSLDYSITLM